VLHHAAPLCLWELSSYEQLVILNVPVFTNRVEYGEAETCSGEHF